MTVEEIAQSYYEAWQNKGGDFSDVPLAEASSSRARWRALRARMGTGKWPRRRARP
jgi:hypothetical protein